MILQDIYMTVSTAMFTHRLYTKDVRSYDSAHWFVDFVKEALAWVFVSLTSQLFETSRHIWRLIFLSILN